MKKKEDNGWEAFAMVTLIGIIIWVVLGGIMRCAGVKGNGGVDDSPWSPRHTYIEKPALNTVNT